MCELLDALRARHLSENTVAGALATLSNIVRFAVRNGWIPENAIEKLEASERPRPARHLPRALGREEIARLLDGVAHHGAHESSRLRPARSIS